MAVKTALILFIFWKSRNLWRFEHSLLTKGNWCYMLGILRRFVWRSIGKRHFIHSGSKIYSVLKNVICVNCGSWNCRNITFVAATMYPFFYSACEWKRVLQDCIECPWVYDLEVKINGAKGWVWWVNEYDGWGLRELKVILRFEIFPCDDWRMLGGSRGLIMRYEMNRDPQWL